MGGIASLSVLNRYIIHVKMTHQKRRQFLKTTGLALAGTALPFHILRANPQKTHLNADTIKIGFIGCGGRGTGAANQALKADANAVLYAVADIFPDKMEKSLTNLQKAHGERANVDTGRRFLGFDAYQKVLDSGVDVVILSTPPAFRPLHIEATVKAGVHMFCEKPVAVDAPGIRRVMAAVKTAKEKGLSIVSGFCWRYHEPKRAAFGKVLDGDIGDLNAVYTTYNTGEIWSFPRQPGWSETEYQLRNWYYHNWLSGDHIVEQAVHSIDFMCWAMGGRTPVRAVGTGGRQVRTDALYGHIFDHFAVTYEYGDGARGFHFCRQQLNCDNSYAAEIWGSKGKALIDCRRDIHQVNGRREWKYEGENNNMYQTQHDELFASIRSGKPINDGELMAGSSLTAIMGRMVAYTGKQISWEEALNSNEKLGPSDEYSWDLQVKVRPVARPGITEFI